MESLTEHEHWYTVGGLEEGRVPAARKRLLMDNFYVPFREVTAMGMHQMQRDDRLPRLYSQNFWAGAVSVERRPRPLSRRAGRLPDSDLHQQGRRGYTGEDDRPDV